MNIKYKIKRSKGACVLNVCQRLGGIQICSKLGWKMVKVSENFFLFFQYKEKKYEFFE